MHLRVHGAICLAIVAPTALEMIYSSPHLLTTCSVTVQSCDSAKVNSTYCQSSKSQLSQQFPVIRLQFGCLATSLHLTVVTSHGGVITLGKLPCWFLTSKVREAAREGWKSLWCQPTLPRPFCTLHCTLLPQPPCAVRCWNAALAVKKKSCSCKSKQCLKYISKRYV